MVRIYIYVWRAKKRLIIDAQIVGFGISQKEIKTLSLVKAHTHNRIITIMLALLRTRGGKKLNRKREGTAKGVLFLSFFCSNGCCFPNRYQSSMSILFGMACRPSPLAYTHTHTHIHTRAHMDDTHAYGAMIRYQT